MLLTENHSYSRIAPDWFLGDGGGGMAMQPEVLLRAGAVIVCKVCVDYHSVQLSVSL